MMTSSLVKEREEINIHVTLEATSDIVDSVASMHDMGNAAVGKVDKNGGSTLIKKR